MLERKITTFLYETLINEHFVQFPPNKGVVMSMLINPSSDDSHVTCLPKLTGALDNFSLIPIFFFKKVEILCH